MEKMEELKEEIQQMHELIAITRRSVAELEMAFGLRSSFNFVPEGEYVVPDGLRSWLTGNGFEVGVHDLHHDGNLYSSRRAFEEKAKRINKYLKDWGAVGLLANENKTSANWIKSNWIQIFRENRCEQAPHQFNHTEYSIENEPSVISEDGFLQIDWPPEIVDFDFAAAQQYGVVRANLEKIGKPIGAYDLMIAAHALSLDLVLVTNNEQEFQRIPDLIVENWVKS